MTQRFSFDSIQIGVIGLGYVGLPLAVEFGRKFRVTGFDRKPHRINDLRNGIDRTLEIESSELRAAVHLTYSAEPEALRACNVYIVAVPSPIDSAKRPDFSALKAASATIGRVITAGDIVIYESTVYPGATEEVCIPVIEEISGLQFNIDFFGGYSPERINPGDKGHRLPDIIKITSGSTQETADFVDALYSSIITAGTFKASSIKVAEAAKVIENTQRDVNIALVNELALIFNRLSINTREVLQAAGTKWNFLKFEPGLVGGHCIGVDPYYLTHKAQEAGYHPAMILAGRRVNDDMGSYVATQTIKLMNRKKIDVSRSEVLIMGLTFKENCPDLRNTRVIDIIEELHDHGITVSIHDPWVHPDDAEREYGLQITARENLQKYDAVILAVAHQEFADMPPDALKALCKENHVIFDVKGILPQDFIDGRL